VFFIIIREFSVFIRVFFHIGFRCELIKIQVVKRSS